MLSPIMDRFIKWLKVVGTILVWLIAGPGLAVTGALGLSAGVLWFLSATLVNVMTALFGTSKTINDDWLVIWTIRTIKDAAERIHKSIWETSNQPKLSEPNKLHRGISMVLMMFVLLFLSYFCYVFIKTSLSRLSGWLQGENTTLSSIEPQSGRSHAEDQPASQDNDIPDEPAPSSGESKPAPEALESSPDKPSEDSPAPSESTPPVDKQSKGLPEQFPPLPQPDISPPGYSPPLPPNPPQPESVEPTAAAESSVPNPVTGLATRDVPFVNSLGMKFVPVPMTKVLFCIHEVRKVDFMSFKRDSGLQFSPPLEGSLSLFTDNMAINWTSKQDAEAFCEWLSEKEGRVYRLPTDHEWSCAVGLGELESESKSPQEKDGKIVIYPWGSEFPPPVNAGNYQIAGYEDGHDGVAPVMSYAPNQFGIYDLGGNVWEWCSNRYGPKGVGNLLRGGGWFNFGELFCRSSQRNNDSRERESGWGFRCVLDESRK